MGKLTRVFLAIALLAPVTSAKERIELTAFERIKREALQNSHVMEHAFYLADVYGPRLTGSPAFQGAGDWAVRQLKQYGLEKVRQERFDWGRGWSCRRFAAHLLQPQYAPLIGVPNPWSPGTRGLISGEPILAPLPESTESGLQSYFAQYKGRLKGKFVLLHRPGPLVPATKPTSYRLTDADLSGLARAPAAEPRAPDASAGDWGFWRREQQFFKDEGALAVVFHGYLAAGTVYANGAVVLRHPDEPLPLPAFSIALEQYNRIVRLLQKNVPVRLAVEMETAFHQDPAAGFNVLAEIPGRERRDEVVMIGAHLDSWTGATGATDNAAGCAVALEAVRILKALGLRPRRTIRLALWGGEEGEGLGSATYVSKHFGSGKTPKPEHYKLSCYFNLDNGTGSIRGIYLEGNEAVRPIFEAWLAPFKEMGAATLSPGGTDGTDHVAFDRAGLPGFQFIQDPVEYQRTHHTNMDAFDYLEEGDLRQAAAITAAFAYQAAMREELLPRKSGTRQ